MTADQEEENDKRQDEDAEAGPEVQVCESPALLCNLDRRHVSLQLGDWHFDTKACVDTVSNGLVNDCKTSRPGCAAVASGILCRANSRRVSDVIDAVHSQIVVIVCIDLRLELVVVDHLGECIPEFGSIQMLYLAKCGKIFRTLASTFENVARHRNLL